MTWWWILCNQLDWAEDAWWLVQPIWMDMSGFIQKRLAFQLIYWGRRSPSPKQMSIFQSTEALNRTTKKGSANLLFCSSRHVHIFMPLDIGTPSSWTFEVRLDLYYQPLHLSDLWNLTLAFLVLNSFRFGLEQQPWLSLALQLSSNVAAIILWAHPS